MNPRCCGLWLRATEVLSGKADQKTVGFAIAQKLTPPQATGLV